jgi:hypothetical protein
MITSALLRTETERWREEVTISPPAWSYRRVPWQAWHDKKIPRGQECALETRYMDVNDGYLRLGMGKA